MTWEILAGAMENQNFHFSDQQCQNKWKELRRTYMSDIDKMSQSGVEFEPTCKFFDEMHEIYGKTPSVNPGALASNLSKYKRKLGEKKNDEDIEDEEKENKDQKKKTKIEKNFDSLAKIWLNSAEEREKKRDERHAAMVLLQNTASKKHEELMEKLINKL